jgi:hypothetical protein
VAPRPLQRTHCPGSISEEPPSFYWRDIIDIILISEIVSHFCFFEYSYDMKTREVELLAEAVLNMREKVTDPI